MQRTFGKTLNIIRKNNGLTAQYMADKLNINIRSYRAYESNDREPSLGALVKVANALNVSTDFLLGRTDFPDVVEEPPDSFLEELQGRPICESCPFYELTLSDDNSEA